MSDIDIDIDIRNKLLLGNNVDCPKITDDGYKTFGKGNEIKIPNKKNNQKNYRINVLVDTLEEFVIKDANGISNLEKYTNKSIDNVVEWSKTKTSIDKKVEIFSGDWGEITLDVTKKYGYIYAVLNMANATSVGGGYTSGSGAQEENMWRRSSCHFYAPNAYDNTKTDLINGVNGLVELDMKPRVCIKGQENIGLIGLIPTGYDHLDEKDYFPFWELKAAADNLRNDGKPDKPYNNTSMGRKIKAQFETMKQNRVRHCVLSAFGCGDFGNPSEKVAQLYKEYILEYINYFDHIVFAIYDYNGTTNYKIFVDNILINDVKGNKEFIKHVQLMLQHKILKNLYYLQLYDNTNDVLKHKLNKMYDHINTLNMSGGKYHNMYIKNKEKYIELDKNWCKTYLLNKQNYLNLFNSGNH
uniref:Microbial-type PARG catalytic domain-containing protein n=1 Tax=viral metagenome TaxID=1070528 RepID=A0A6C0BD34_9ZZZZ